MIVGDFMKKRVSCRAIIIENDKVFVIFRRKVKDNAVYEYYALPGGGKEENETLEETVIREIKEEFSIDIKILGYLGKDEKDNTITHFFHCERINGEFKLGGPELKRNNPNNYYEITCVDIKDIYNINTYYPHIIEKAYKREYEKR